MILSISIFQNVVALLCRISITQNCWNEDFVRDRDWYLTWHPVYFTQPLSGNVAHLNISTFEGKFSMYNLFLKIGFDILTKKPTRNQ